MHRQVAILVLLFSQISATSHAADKCPDAQPYPTNGIEVTATASSVGMFVLVNDAKGGSNAKFCWLTEADLLAGHTCANPDPITERPPLVVATCKGGKNNFAASPSSDDITGADVILIQFSPTAASQTVRYLRLEAKDKDNKDIMRMYKITGTAGVPNLAEDSRYKVWLYGGYTYLRTKSDFKNGYPELLMRFETRLIDQSVAMKKHDPVRYDAIQRTGKDCDAQNCRRARFEVFRLYGETGLTGTAIVNTDSQTPPPPRVRQAFEGSFGVGYGLTFPVATEKAGDTSAFSLMLVSRLGIVTIPGLDADPNANPPITETKGSTAFSWVLGPRIENEKGGNFEGAYFEIGMGESEQFTNKKVPRLRADGLIPLGASSDLFRFAGRMQIDTTRPFHQKENVEPAGEIRISILFNIDIHELAKRLGGK